MTAPLMVLCVPLLDTALAVARRFLRNEPIFGADRGHIHHRLLERGFTTRRIALMIYGFSGLAGIFSLLQSIPANRFSPVIVVMFCVVTSLAIWSLRYVEFHVASRAILSAQKFIFNKWRSGFLRRTISKNAGELSGTRAVI